MESPLHVAVRNKEAQLVSDLLNQGCDVNAKEINGSTPLHFAVKAECTNILKMLLESGAKINAQDVHKNTPLHVAAKITKNLDILILLVEYGADVNAIEFHGYTPLHVAVESNNIEIVELLLIVGANVNAKDVPQNVTPLHKAAESKNINILRLLLDHGADVNAKDKCEDTPLNLAIKSKSLNILRLLLNSGADTNIECKSVYGKSPLQLAVEMQNLTILEILLESGADVNAKNYWGDAPLHLAVLKSENIKIFKLLINAGANVNQPCRDGRLPLVLLTYKLINNDWISEIFRLLIELSDINLSNKQGKNILLEILESKRVHVNGEYTYKIIMEHVAKLKTLELEIHQGLLNYIVNSKRNKYLVKCLEELEKAKNTKLRNCWLTFFNLLVDDKSKLVKYAGNQDLVRDFKKNVKNFPIFKAWLESNVYEGIESRKLYDNAANVLSSFLPIFSPNHLIMRGLLDTMSKENWKKLSQGNSM